MVVDELTEGRKIIESDGVREVGGCEGEEHCRGTRHIPNREKEIYVCMCIRVCGCWFLVLVEGNIIWEYWEIILTMYK